MALSELAFVIGGIGARFNHNKEEDIRGLEVTFEAWDGVRWIRESCFLTNSYKDPEINLRCLLRTFQTVNGQTCPPIVPGAHSRCKTAVN